MLEKKMPENFRIIEKYETSYKKHNDQLLNNKTRPVPTHHSEAAEHQRQK